MTASGFPLDDKRDPASFSAEWLALREPFDTSARALHSARLLACLPSCAGRGLAGQRPEHDRHDDTPPLTVIDLACGSGANLRFLLPRLGGHQQWRLIDRDARLLDHAATTTLRWVGENVAGGRASRRTDGSLHITGDHGLRVDVEFIRLDLATHPHQVGLGSARLVTASALLDLVSAQWLEQLIAACVAARCEMLLALSVDGRLDWQTPDPDDGLVVSAFECHQRRDKGFGPALGAQAAAHATRLLTDAGYRWLQTRSDWCLDEVPAGAPPRDLQRQLIDGMHQAALDVTPAEHIRFDGWADRRRRGLRPDGCSIGPLKRVGHIDIAAWPADTP